MIYSAVAAVLVLSSCSSAYQTAQTPDDVYHSPARQQTVYASNTVRNTQGNAVEETYDDNGDTYVTYQDEDDERYDYARRIDNFSRGYRGNYWDGYYYDDFYGSPNVYINNYYGSRWNTWGSYWGPSISLGWGYNPYRWGGWYSPWYGYSSPWYSPWYGSGWYGGGYGHGWYGSGWYGGGGWYGGHYPGGYYTTRPSNSWGPRGSSSSRVFNNAGSYNSNHRTNTGSMPRRTFDRSSGGNYTPSNGTSAPRRTFDNRSSERPSVQPNNSAPRRTFDNRSSERPATQPSNQRRIFERSSSERPVSQPRYEPSRSVDRSAPVRQAPVRSEPTYRAPEPQRSYPSPSSSPSNSSGSSAPARTFRPRGG